MFLSAINDYVQMLVKYLIERPVAVTAIYLSVLAASIYGWFVIPVNLLPDVDPPELTIEVRSVGSSAETIETASLSRIRQAITGAFGLKDIESEATQGFGRITLTYEYQTDMDLAMVEANEKIDRIISVLPTDLERPLVRKKKPTDIPVIRIHLSSEFVGLSELSEVVVFDLVKRFEQLEGVARVEAGGLVRRSIQLIPRMDRLIAAKLNLTDLTSIVGRSNLLTSQVQVKEGLYEYLIQIDNLIQDVESLQTLKVRTPAGQVAELRDFFEIKEGYLNPEGYHFYYGKRGIVLAIHGQPNANMIELKEEIDRTVELS